MPPCRIPAASERIKARKNRSWANSVADEESLEPFRPRTPRFSRVFEPIRASSPGKSGTFPVRTWPAKVACNSWHYMGYA